MAKKETFAHQNLTINISHRTIIFAVLLLISIKFIYNIREILALLFITFLLVVAISPLINWLENKKIPRTLSSLLALTLIFLAVAGTVASIVTPLVSQTQIFLQKIPDFVDQLAPYNINLSSLTPSISNVPGNFLKIAFNTFTGLITFFTLLVISFYLLQTRPKWSDYFQALFGGKGLRYYHALTELEIKLGHWVRGELLLMFTVGLTNYLGFVLIGLPFAIPLGVIAGFLELIPNIGPTIAVIPAALVGFSISPTHGLLAILVSIIVQQLENNLLVPNIMRKVVGLHPVVTIVSILIGYRLGGPALAILSLPLVLSLQTVIAHLKIDQKTKKPTFT